MSYYKMHRGWMDNDLFPKERFTEREAWEWLISGAAWQQEGIIIPVNHNPVRIMRGQLSHSLRFMGDLWKWDKAKVSRFLNKLKKWDMIETATETGQILITICNYNIYQDSETATETGLNDKPIRKRDRGETNIKNLNNINKEEKNIDGDFSQFWDAYPSNGRRKGDKKNSEKAFSKARLTIPLDVIMKGLKNYETYLRSSGEYNADAATWINRAGWEDDYNITAAKTHNGGRIGHSVQAVLDGALANTSHRPEEREKRLKALDLDF